MLVTLATPRDHDAWLDLAVSISGQAETTGLGELSIMMEHAFRNREALVAIDRMTGVRAGFVGFSRDSNHIFWLGVAQPFRHQGIGTRLFVCARNQLDNSRAITVQRLASAQSSETVEVLAPEPARAGESFHHRADRYLRWSEPSGCPVCRDLPGPSDIVTIAKLAHSWVEASPVAQGCLWGKCHVLYATCHRVELFDMPRDELLAFMTDVQQAARVLKRVTGAMRINYEIHGNTMPHIHAHLFPRYLDDPFPGSAIDVRVVSPSPYRAGEFDYFVDQMRRYLACEERGTADGVAGQRQAATPRSVIGNGATAEADCATAPTPTQEQHGPGGATRR